MIAPATFYPDTATTLGRLEKKQAGVSELLPQDGPVEGWSPGSTLGALPPDDAQVYPPPPSLSLPTYLPFKGTAVSEQSGLRHKLRCDLWLAGVPKRQLCCGVACAQSKGAVGGSRRSPLTGTTPCLRRCRRVCPGVSVCGRAGLPEERGAGGRGADCPRQLLGLKDTSGKADLCKLSTFYSKLEAPGLLTSHLL